ncbi:hypothetical protein Tsubulata_025947 [Turnera subulata]|uniref:Pectinesterase inhibitor domain-containing protein n=1 Tax=Turnera subulata TaxID=218843 RepID=A0A9Q0G678_9ROSI|nr:hypothetical protein Tsubulata_025947 [Turnera subulata]
MVSPASFLVPFLLFLSLCITPSIAISEAEKNDICSNSMNPRFCGDFMKAEQRVASADFAGVAKIGVEVAHSRAKDTLNFLKSLIQKTTDPKVQEVYKSCSSNYEEAVSVFEEAKKYLSSKNYGGATTTVSAAMDHADSCKDDAQGTDPSLPERNENLKSLCSIILVVTDRL